MESVSKDWFATVVIEKNSLNELEFFQKKKKEKKKERKKEKKERKEKDLK